MEDILSGSIRDVRFRAGLLAGFDVFQDPAALTIGEIRGGALFEQGDITLGAPVPDAEQALALTERPAGQTPFAVDQRESAKRLANA